MGENHLMKKMISLGLLLLLFFNIVGMADISSVELHRDVKSIKTTHNNDADLPQWSIGDRWIYQTSFAGAIDDNSRFDLSINQFIMEVQTQTEEQYEVAIEVPQGEISGNIRIQSDMFSIEGDIVEAKIDGMLYIRKNTLEMINFQLILDGFIDKIVDIPFSIAIDLNFYNQSLMKTNFSTLRFPLNTGIPWVLPTILPVANISLNLLPEPMSVFFSFVSHQFLCESWETFTIGSTEYDALKITGDLGSKNEIYYAVSAGNIIKLDYENIDAGFGTALTDVEMKLLSTTYSIYSNPPSSPEIIDGSHEPIIGQNSEYIFRASDPDLDAIKYIIEWGDGDTTVTDFQLSGKEIICSHTWNAAGTFEIKAKARDKYGSESTWSTGYSVTITNDAPTIPSMPSGPTTGKIQQSCTYTTQATDPDAHQIQYGWDWDGDSIVDEWTSLTDSGVEISTSHTWYTEGQYSIRVKAKDAYGFEGHWSEPLGVTMPKSKYLYLYHWMMQYQLFYQRFIEQYHLQIL